MTFFIVFLTINCALFQHSRLTTNFRGSSCIKNSTAWYRSVHNTPLPLSSRLQSVSQSSSLSNLLMSKIIASLFWILRSSSECGNSVNFNEVLFFRFSVISKLSINRSLTIFNLLKDKSAARFPSEDLIEWLVLAVGTLTSLSLGLASLQFLMWQGDPLRIQFVRVLERTPA